MLSGLYGLLRPLDAIRPYRLEMGTRWAPRHSKLTDWWGDRIAALLRGQVAQERSEEHTSELQSLMRISYAVFCLKKKKRQNSTQHCYRTQPTYKSIIQLQEYYKNKI